MIAFGFIIPSSGSNSSNQNTTLYSSDLLSFDSSQNGGTSANYNFLTAWNAAKLNSANMRSSLTYTIQKPDASKLGVQDFLSATQKLTSTGLNVNTARKVACAVQEPKQDQQQIAPAQEKVAVPAEPAISAAIYVNGNEGLTRFPGSGTQEDPYVIEVESLVCDSNLIAILNTDAYVSIQNSYFANVEVPYFGIFLWNTQHVTVQDNTFNYNAASIAALYSSDVTIRRNAIYSSSVAGAVVAQSDNFNLYLNNVTSALNGILVTQSQNGQVNENRIVNSGKSGIEIDSSNHINLASNTLSNNMENGIFLQNSNNNVLEKNFVYGSGYLTKLPAEYALKNSLSLNGNNLVIAAAFSGSGIYLDPSVNNTVVDNVLSENDGMGLLLESSNGTVISGNSINGNGLTGIFFEDSSHNQITHNNVTSNGDIQALANLGLTGYNLIRAAAFSGSGIYLDPSFDNEISDNMLTGNTANGLALEYSENTKISNNDIGNNGLTGISFTDSDNNQIQDNLLSNNGYTGAALAAQFTTNGFEARIMAAFSGSGIYLDPSAGNTMSGNILTNNAGTGVYLQESTETSVDNNQIQGNGMEGVFLENSSYNSISSNLLLGNGYQSSNYIPTDGVSAESIKVMAAFSGSGIYLDPSQNNSVTDNLVAQNAASGIFSFQSDNTLYLGNQISENGAHGIYFVESNYNNITSNEIDENGVSQTGLLGLNAAFSGSGIYLDPSYGNVVAYNNLTRNTEYGVHVEGSSGTLIRENRMTNNTQYGVFIDYTSSSTDVSHNNFLDNNNGDVQASNDGEGSKFAGNWWSDNDNTDKNHDGIADHPYQIAGTVPVEDTTPSNIKNGLNYYIATHAWTNPRVLNVDSHGHPLTVKIRLTDGYRALDVDPTKFTLNGTVVGFYAEIRDILTFKVVFKRSEVNNLVKSWENTCRANSADQASDPLQHRDRRSQKPDPCVLQTAVLVLHGRMNKNLLDITAYIQIRIKHEHHRHYSWRTVYHWCVAGISLAPASKLSKKLRYVNKDL